MTKRARTHVYQGATARRRAWNGTSGVLPAPCLEAYSH